MILMVYFYDLDEMENHVLVNCHFQSYLKKKGRITESKRKDLWNNHSVLPSVLMYYPRRKNEKLKYLLLHHTVKLTIVLFQLLFLLIQG